MLPTTTGRVRASTAPQINAEIDAGIERSVRRLAGDRDAIERRLAELDREWDIERTLEANAATISLIGVGLAVAADRRFLALPAIVAAFLLQHAVQGWCPPVPMFRRLGVRTAEEIGRERYALKAVRGDFAAVEHTADAPARIETALDAARA